MYDSATLRPGGLERAGTILPSTHPDMVVSKQKLRRAEVIELVREKRETANQTLGFASRPESLVALPMIMNRIFCPFWLEMDVGYALLCGLLVELAGLGFAVAGYFEEALGEFDGVFFGLGLDEGEASDILFGFGEGAVGDGVVAAGVANARAEGGGEAAFLGEQVALFKGLLDEFAHCFPGA